MMGAGNTFDVELLPGRQFVRTNQGQLAGRLHGTNLNSNGSRHGRLQMPSRPERFIDLRTWPDWGTLIEMRPNSSGVVDDQRLLALERQLAELTDDPAAGDIVISMARVAVMTAAFMSLLAVIRPQLACQNRRLSLHGLRPECTAMLQDSGLEDLVAGAVHQAAADAAPMFLLDCALTARSRGSERAA